ncbi:MAG: 5-formyltetrahydrofolate cyclo-ligase [Coriobacteriales bacterium]|nr:5-formyltetrahydrofolate cyclo-ligase [Coriobacteriales bacterium]
MTDSANFTAGAAMATTRIANKEAGKAELRSLVLAKRQQLDEQSTGKSDARIGDRILSYGQYGKARMVLCYASTPGEVATDGIILNALASGKRVCLPRCENQGIMHAYEIHSLSDLVEGRYGIREPNRHCKLISPRELDLVIAPCVSCTKRGDRLGYGGGYYDRYLTLSDCPVCVLCREALILDHIPASTHDVVMDAVITETGITYAAD